ncbi:MAG: SLC13 family permease, partial [Pontibacterium sp.]
ALVLYISGVLSFDSFSSSYVNLSLVILIGFVLLSSVLEKTIFLTAFSQHMLSKNLRASLLRLGLGVGVASAFLNNTAVVAALMGPLRRQKALPFKKLLLPLSYFSILGGVLTLVGTSTNLLVNGFVIQVGLDAFNLFDFSLIGLAVLLACGLVVVFISSYLLPSGDVDRSNENFAAYFIERQVADWSSLIGKTVQANKLRQLHDLYLVEIIRDGRVIAPVVSKEVICAGDRLVFSGDVSAVDILNQFNGLVALVAPNQAEEQKGQSQLVEVAVSPSSIMLGRSVKEADFRSRFDAGIVAIRRGEQQISGGIGRYRFQAGDSLILSVGDDFKTRRELLQNFILVGEVSLNDQLATGKSVGVLFGFLGVIVAAALGASLVKGVLLLLGLCVAFKVVRINDLRRRFPFDLVLVIGGALCLAKAMAEVGLDTDLAHLVNGLFGSSAFMAYVGVFVLTWLLTEVITNNAAAALAFPVAVATAEIWQVSPYPFILAVIFGASASFVSPFGYQTNLMVFSVGQYKVKDYVKAGLPVLVVYLVTAVSTIPLLFPF